MEIQGLSPKTSFLVSFSWLIARISVVIVTPFFLEYDCDNDLINFLKITFYSTIFMVGRGLTGNSSNSPGPGHYEHELNDITAKERAPTYRIGSASRTERPNSGYVPGPGNYETRGKEIGPK